MKISIKLSNGKIETKFFDQSVVAIGRSVKNDFVVVDEALSRQHCKVEFLNGEFYITDLGSANGIYVDGLRIPANTRTHLTTFLQVLLATLECHVTEAEQSYNPKPSMNLGMNFPTAPQAPQPAGASNTKTTRKINTYALKNPVEEPKVVPKKSGPNVLVAMLAMCLAVGICFYQFMDSPVATEEIVDTKVTNALLLEKNVPPQFKKNRDVFLTAEAYNNLELEKSCEGPFCQDLKLDGNRGEGVVEKNRELFIYLQPELHLINPLIKEEFKTRDGMTDIAAFLSLLSSDTFDQFVKKKYAQIHLIMKRHGGKNEKVFRFHTKNFAGNERGRLLNVLGGSLETGKTTPFWKAASPHFDRMNL